ncbi:MAG: MmcQ/YjbR family DNA-binding protein [Vicinamibacterales bacterium]
MTAEDFRRIALGMKDAIESAHMGHPDFRVDGRIFATLHGDLKWGMVKLTPEQQERFVAEAPACFVPEKGAWGLQGCTAVQLDVVDEDVLGEAMTLAWRNANDKGAAGRKARTRRRERSR